MLNFLAQHWGTILVSAALALLLLLAVRSLIKTKKQGGCSGCSGCSGCPHGSCEPSFGDDKE